MQTTYQTERLLIRALTSADGEFMQMLVNTPGWLEFIGDRNIHSPADADAYINRLLNAPAVQYRVVTLRSGNEPIGVVTLIKKEYLDHPDLGFAFLPEYNGQGYAYEAADAVLTDVLATTNHDRILATTLPANLSSIRLLERLGFRYEREIEPNGEQLRLYGVSART